MRNLFLFISFLLLFACDTANESEPQLITNGYAILNQGSISSIDYYDLELDSLISGVYQLNNNGATLSSYAEHIYQDNQFIYVTLQGDFWTGNGGRVIFLNRQFENIHEISDHPANGNTLYVGRFNDFLIVSYRIADANFNYSYVLRKYQIRYANDVLNVSQSGNDLTLLIDGFSGGRFQIIDNHLYIASGKLVQIIELNSFVVQASLNLAKPVSDLAIFNNQVYAAIYNLSDVQNETQDLVDGGFYIINGTSVIDSLIGNYGYKKLLGVNNRLFGIRWTGSGRSINWPYSFSDLTTDMVEITGKSETSLFTETSLAAISDYWSHFQFDDENQRFLLPGTTDFISSNFYIRGFSGSLIRETMHPGQASSVILIKNN